VDKTRLTGWLTLGVAALAPAAAMTMPPPLSALPRAYGATSARESASQVDHRGELVSAEHLRTLSAKQAAAELASDRFDPGTVRYGVDTYRLVYYTIDAQGRPTIASGLLVLPRNHARPLLIVSFTHGTELF